MVSYPNQDQLLLLVALDYCEQNIYIHSLEKKD